MTEQDQPQHEAIIIGAGVAGIYQMYRLQELGIEATVLEAADGPGGTWYWNRYPGARFDSESYTYGYSSPKSCSRSGSGASTSPASRKPCATSITSSTSSTSAATCSSAARSRARRSTKTVASGPCTWRMAARSRADSC